MRILVVGQTYPWPTTSGAKMRLANVITALARLGQTDLFAFVGADRFQEPGDLDIAPPVRLGVDRIETVARVPSRYSGVRRLTWFARGNVPASLDGRDYRSVVARFGKWAGGPYDFVWFSRVESYLAIGEEIRAPAVVDIDDLRHHLEFARLGVIGADGPSAPADRLRRPFVKLRARRDALLWAGLYRKVSASVSAVAVCSELDRTRIDVPNAVVVPNGYEPPERPLGRREVRTPPTVLFPGFLQYGPNVDAARYLVERISPELRACVPDVQIRLVGRVDARVQRLNDPPKVVVTGPVHSIEAELAKADLVAVPVRYGSGTRVKILEAFAHRIPVVSTSIGVEGIDAVDGVHLLIGDSSEDFAAACARLLSDTQLRTGLVDEAHGRLLELYQWEGIREDIGDLARSIVNGSPEAGRRAV